MTTERPCDVTGRCEPPDGATGVASCQHCGRELVEGPDPGCWFTWDWEHFVGTNYAGLAMCQTHDRHCRHPDPSG